MTAPPVRERFRHWLDQHRVSDPGSTADWLAHLDTARYEPGDHLVRCGERSDTLFLLESGLVRLYYSTPDGRERNKAFYRGGQVTGPVSAAISGSAAPFSIESLEPTAAITFRFRDLLAAADADPAVARLYREMLADAFIRNEQREAMLLTANAEQRYRWVLAHEPDLPGRVAQFHLASYLGIDAVSLSRIKRKIKADDGSAH